jgi:hypothetical protein
MGSNNLQKLLLPVLINYLYILFFFCFLGKNCDMNFEKVCFQNCCILEIRKGVAKKQISLL